MSGIKWEGVPQHCMEYVKASCTWTQNIKWKIEITNVYLSTRLAKGIKLHVYGWFIRIRNHVSTQYYWFCLWLFILRSWALLRIYSIQYLIGLLLMTLYSTLYLYLWSSNSKYKWYSRVEKLNHMEIVINMLFEYMHHWFCDGFACLFTAVGD